MPTGSASSVPILPCSGVVFGFHDNLSDRKMSSYRENFGVTTSSSFTGNQRISKERVARDLLESVENWCMPETTSASSFVHHGLAKTGRLTDDVRRDLRASHFRLGERSSPDWETSHKASYREQCTELRENDSKRRADTSLNLFSSDQEVPCYESESMRCFRAPTWVPRESIRADSPRSNIQLSCSEEALDYATVFSESFKKHESNKFIREDLSHLKEELRKSHFSHCLSESSMKECMSEAKSQFKWP